ncbi:MAG: hypothetical protein R2865_05570 [Deinococcales bacterium]
MNLATGGRELVGSKDIDDLCAGGAVDLTVDLKMPSNAQHQR